MRRVALIIVLAATAVSVRAIEFTLPDGTKISGARVDHIEGNLAVVEYDGGVTTVPVADLPAALRPKKLPPSSTARATMPIAAATPAPPRLGTPPPPTTATAPPAAPTNAPTIVLPSAQPAPAQPRGAPRADYVIDPLKGVVPVPPPPAPGDARRAVPADTPGRVVVTAEAVPYIDRFAEDEDNPTMKRYQDNLLQQKKKKDEKDAPKDVLDLPIFRYSPMRDPNKSAFQSPVIRSEDQFNIPNYMKPGSYVDDPYGSKNVPDNR
jgi:hypothetical protein